jgi:integrase
MAARKRRKKHPGVVLLKPDPKKRMGWRARFKDPDRSRMVYVALPAEYTTIELREEWAGRKSRELAKRRLELDDGAPRATGTALADAIKRYHDAHPHLRDRTRTVYERSTDKLLMWASGHGVESADQLTRAKLLAFREQLIAEPKLVAAPNAKRGTYVPSNARRASVSVNQELRSVRTVLGYLRDLDLLPRLTHDDLRRALKHLPLTMERAEYLKPAEIRKLLEAALRHDAETFDETREEHRGGGTTGRTPRYDAVAPFVAFVLITGMRFGEALALDWSQVDLDAFDHEGVVAGEIYLAGGNTKTHKARTVGLEVSPSLRKLLAASYLASGGKGRLFSFTRATAEAAAKRLRKSYGAPERFSWQLLRSTCATYLTNAPGIFGAASAYRSAKQLGHSVQVAEKHYTGVLRGIPHDARTLDEAMGIGALLAGLQVSGEHSTAVTRLPFPALRARNLRA